MSFTSLVYYTVHLCKELTTYFYCVCVCVCLCAYYIVWHIHGNRYIFYEMGALLF